MIGISIYSGKCDFYDAFVEIHGYNDETLNNANIYVGKSTEPLAQKSMVDLIPYYPYIIAISAFDNEKKKSMIVLSSESFVDREEIDILTMYFEEVMKVYRRCKRKKIKFVAEEATNEISYLINKERILEIAKRVEKYGKKASIDGIHLPCSEYYRQNLVDEMLRNGLNPADYGYERFVKE